MSIKIKPWVLKLLALQEVGSWFKKDENKDADGEVELFSVVHEGRRGP